MHIASRPTRKAIYEGQKTAILDLIRRSGPISRRDLARELRLRASSVSFHVKELVTWGVIHEIGTDIGSGGRPAVLLDFPSNTLLVAGALIAIDHIAGVVCDLCGNVVRQDRVDLPNNPTGKNVIAGMTALAEILTDGLVNDRFQGLGIAVPGFVDQRNGNWLEFGAMPLCRNVALESAISETCGINVFLENDTRASALAEKWFANERDFGNLLFVKIDEFLSSVLMIEGKIIRGASDSAGELGHISFDPNGKRCYCGGHGCLEGLVTQQSLFDLVQKRLGGDVVSIIPELMGEAGIMTLDIMRRALDTADKIALDALAELCVPLGTGLSTAVNMFNPTHMIIGGNLSALGEHLLRPLVCEIRARALSRAVSALKIQISDLVDMPSGQEGAAIALEACFSEGAFSKPQTAAATT